jgi:hypothetical protein
MYVIEIYAPGSNPGIDDPVEILPPVPRAESAVFRIRQLEEQEAAKPEAERRIFRANEIPFIPSERRTWEQKQP